MDALVLASVGQVLSESEAGCHGSSASAVWSNASTFSWRTGRDIPSFFILEIKVVRFSPRRAAAPRSPPTIQPDASNARRITARCDSQKLPSCAEGNAAKLVLAGFAPTRFAS